MAEYAPPDLPPPPGADATPAAIAEWERRARYAELLSVDRERANVQAHRAALEAHWLECNPTAMGEVLAPTIDRVLVAWSALDARLGQLAAALGYKPPAPPPPPPFML